jgi:hypothetical protein
VRGTIDRNGYKILLVDSPGFDSGVKPDISLLEEFVQFLKKMALDGITLSGILYLHRITDIRMSGSAMRNMDLLRVLCGDHFLDHVTLVTTMWDSVHDRVGQDREQELQSTFWRETLVKGAAYNRHYGNQETADNIINRYLDDRLVRTGVKSSIEQEAVDSHRPLQETDAGQFALEELRQNIQAYEKKLQGMRDTKREIEELNGLELQAAQIFKEIEKGEEELSRYKRILAGDRGTFGGFDPRGSDNQRHARSTSNDQVPLHMQGNPHFQDQQNYHPGPGPVSPRPPHESVYGIPGNQRSPGPSIFNPYNY